MVVRRTSTIYFLICVIFFCILHVVSIEEEIQFFNLGAQIEENILLLQYSIASGVLFSGHAMSNQLSVHAASVHMHTTGN